MKNKTQTTRLCGKAAVLLLLLLLLKCQLALAAASVRLLTVLLHWYLLASQLHISSLGAARQPRQTLLHG
jgi:hypothetical protein